MRHPRREATLAAMALLLPFTTSAATATDATDLLILDQLTCGHPERAAGADPVRLAELSRGNNLTARLGPTDLRLLEASEDTDLALPLQGLQDHGVERALLWTDNRALERTLPLPDDDLARTAVLVEPTEDLERAILLKESLPVTQALLLTPGQSFENALLLVTALGTAPPVPGNC